MRLSKLIMQKLDGLLQKQHKLYPHLVPAYRTVHRTKPRTLVFRAIRWVNPERYFPLMSASADTIKKWSKDQWERAIVQYNEYRKEAQTIQNRYDQMIGLIEQGKTPYRIMWPEKKWLTLDERMDRAQALRKATTNWGMNIDKKGALMRTVGLNQHDTRLDDVDKLWENDNIPAFKDTKKGRDPDGYKRALRTTRDRKKVRDEARVDERRFKTPAPEEMRDEERPLMYRPTPTEVEEEYERPTTQDELLVRGPIATVPESLHLPHSIKTLRYTRLKAHHEWWEEEKRKEKLVNNIKQRGKGAGIEWEYPNISPIVPRMGWRIPWSTLDHVAALPDAEEMTDGDREVVAQEKIKISSGKFADEYDGGVKLTDDGTDIIETPKTGLSIISFPSVEGHYQASVDAGQLENALGLNVMAPTTPIDKGEGTEDEERGRYSVVEDQLKGKSPMDMEDDDWNDVMQDDKARQSMYAIAMFDLMGSRRDARDDEGLIFSNGRFFAIGNHKQFDKGTEKTMFKYRMNNPRTRAFPGDSADYEEEIDSFVNKFLTENVTQESIGTLMGAGFSASTDPINQDDMKDYLRTMVGGKTRGAWRGRDVVTGRAAYEPATRGRLRTPTGGTPS